MGRRSLQASEQGIQAIKKALKSKKWSQTYLAGAAGCSRQTIWSLLQGNPTDCDVLMEVCNQLGLRQEEVTEPELLEPEPDHSEQIAALVQVARESIRPYIQERCGMMRVLDMEQPIGLGDIYTSVNILERITGRRGLDISELMQNADPEQFDRFCLGKVREKRVPGLEAVEKFSKLMILGKPGAGKTTFLKHLAIQCIGGEFQSDRVPIFITLKDFAEADDKPNLFTYIERLIAMPNVGAKHLENIFLSNAGSDRPNVSPLHNILRGGKALILLDGLDEVREADNNRVLRQIREFSEQFAKNQFVITCRIAAREYTFVQFTDVEVDDFNYEQIADFVHKWFNNKKDSIKAEWFLQHLEEDVPIQELASSPLLLTLLCLVFEDSGSFPSNRADLYKNGTDVLLKKWDTKRNIQREQVYKELSLRRKEALLSQVALNTFEAGSYFFKERDIRSCISSYIQNLPNVSNEPEVLELDSTAVLKTIESQHGLLIERARGIYSFSHLTFHEYFAAHQICTSCNQYSIDDEKLKILANHITEKRWQEIFLLVAILLDSADIFLNLVKKNIDNLVRHDDQIQNFLYWLSQKSNSTSSPYKIATVRAFYLSQVLDIDFIYEDFMRLDWGIENAYENVENFLEANEFDTGKTYQIPEYEIGFIFDQGLFHSLERANSLCDTKWTTRNLKHFYESYQYLAVHKFQEHLGFVRDEQFKHNLCKLSSQLPICNSSSLEVLDWWRIHGRNWALELQSSLMKFRNIGHKWQFSDEQITLLYEYSYANTVLVKCLSSDCYMSREVRQEIEDTLLLPIAEIEKWKQQYDSQSKLVEE